MAKFLKKSKQRGFVSTEIGIGVFVIGVLGLAGYLSASSLLDDSSANVLVSQTADTVKNVKNKYRYQGDFTGLTSEQVISLDAAPRTLVSGKVLVNNYGGTMTFTPTKCTSTNDCIQLVQTNLPKNACIEYVNGLFEGSYDIKIGSKTVKAAGATSLTPSTLSSSCATSGNSVTSRHTRV